MNVQATGGARRRRDEVTRAEVDALRGVLGTVSVKPIISGLRGSADLQ